MYDVIDAHELLESHRCVGKSVIQVCVAVCCSVLQRVAVCCSVLQCVAVFCSMLQYGAVCCSVLQCFAVCCSVLQRVAARRTYSGRLKSQFYSLSSR